MAKDAQHEKAKREIHAIRDELAKLGKEFSRFNERLRKLMAHIEQVHLDVAQVHKTSEKITARFSAMTKVRSRPKLVK